MPDARLQRTRESYPAPLAVAPIAFSDDLATRSAALHAQAQADCPHYWEDTQTGSVCRSCSLER